MDNTGSQGRTQGNAGTNKERDPQQGLDSMDQQGIGTEGQDIHNDQTNMQTPLEQMGAAVDEQNRSREKAKS